MRFLSDRRAITAVEYIIIGTISLVVIAAAIWQLAGSIAARLNDFNNAL
ncbi:MAG: Flp family type IVb pilin [Anaerolineae bacterium]|nr:Flp family type IVb pilin [Anaerolineae bacterium]